MAEDPYIGRELGHCRLERKLGSGGMGKVYLAHHEGLHKKVAVKILPDDLAAEPEFIQRFLREARLAARLEHPNVVQVYDAGEEQGAYYLCMQYVEGRTLEAVLRERKKLSIPEALAITKRVAIALGAAHKLGIVHRDIKPANILISKDGIVKVADFGLAKDRDAGRSVSGTGQIMGTPYYMSPEQAQGAGADPRSDIYSLGTTLYHMVTGRRVFEGESPLSIVMKHLREEPVPPDRIDPSIPEGVCRLIAKMMAKDPASRHPSAEELVRDLDALKPSISKASASPSGPSRRRAARVALPIAGILIVGIVIGMVLAGGGGPRPDSAAPRPPVLPASPPASGPPPAPPAPSPPAPAPETGRKDSILPRLREHQEKKLEEKLLARTEEFLKAAQKRDLKAMRSMLDRATLGDSDSAGVEGLPRILTGPAILLAWDIQDVQVRVHGLGPHTGTSTASYRLKGPAGEFTVQGSPILWIYRNSEETWYIARAPRPK